MSRRSLEPRVNGDLNLPWCHDVKQDKPQSRANCALQFFELRGFAGNASRFSISFSLWNHNEERFLAKVLELRDLKKERRLELVAQAAMHWATREFEEAFGKLWRADATDAEGLERQVSFVDLGMVADFHAAVARLALEGLVPTRALTGYFPFSYTWNKMKPWIVAERAASGLPGSWSDLEKMAVIQEREGGILATGKTP